VFGTDYEEALMTAGTAQLNKSGTFKHTKTVGIVMFLVATGIPIVGILTADARGVETSPGLGDWIFVGIVAAIAAATFGLIVPWALRGEGSRTAGVTLSAFAFVASFVAFWTMVPLILGAAGGLIGYETRQTSDRNSKQRLGLAAMILGTIAVVVSVAATIATS